MAPEGSEKEVVKVALPPLKDGNALTHATRVGEASDSSLLHRLGIVAIGLTILVPLLVGTSSSDPNAAIGVQGGVIQKRSGPILDFESGELARRADSPTDVCTRWAHQCRCLQEHVISTQVLMHE